MYGVALPPGYGLRHHRIVSVAEADKNMGSVHTRQSASPLDRLLGF